MNVWYPGDGQWERLYGLKHCQPVSITAWCTMTGKGESPLLMLARSVDKSFIQQCRSIVLCESLNSALLVVLCESLYAAFWVLFVLQCYVCS